MTYAKLLLALGIWMIFTSEGQTDDWLGGFKMDLSEFQRGIQQGVQNLQYNIQQNVEKSLADVRKLTANIEENVQEAIKKGELKSYATDGSTIITSGPGTIITNGGLGTSRIITSGHLPNGQPYSYDIEDKVIGRTFYHTEKYYNQTKGGIDVTGYTLDLDDPNAKPVPLKPHS
ncbi:uncharacterized protein LOC118449821 isoform X1 [Vespa mandarinia]|uniref:uncharacterized protein LOC118449821 isoform X1 n=2 Tax=Vespa mandarinia TaxID=7446 RepID=UPI00160827AC|nr:uncharacterized protein LOC118449821 isoform X1 [Vespa mandarinia]